MTSHGGGGGGRPPLRRWTMRRRVALASRATTREREELPAPPERTRLRRSTMTVECHALAESPRERARCQIPMAAQKRDRTFHVAESRRGSRMRDVTEKKRYLGTTPR